MFTAEKFLELFLDLYSDLFSYSIDTLIHQKEPFGKIDYKPEYQREYVWDVVKATSYIESILMGNEIPPKIFWVDDYNELIDGRQRYETLLKFINNEFELKDKGLYILKFLRNKKFQDLSQNLQNLFKNSFVRTLMISMRQPGNWNGTMTDQIKKAIFRRYNSGITTLKDVEIARAKYISNDLTQYFRKKFEQDRTFFNTTALLLSNVKNKQFFDLVEIILAKIRPLLVIENIPIDFYITNKGKMYARNLFDSIKGSTSYNEKIYKGFVEKIEILNIIKNEFDKKAFPHYVSIYEVFYWVLSVLDKENISIQKCNDKQFVKALVKFVSENKSPMLINDSENLSSYMVNKLRYHNIAQFVGQYFCVDFSKYFSITTEIKNHAKELDTMNSIQVLEEDLRNIQLGTPDPRSLVVSELLNYVTNDNFIIRPPFQRNESMDKTKASGLIESLLLGFKILPLFIYEKIDGTKVVIDGQQRLLALLGFVGKEYRNEEGVLVNSAKHCFKLQGLEVMEDLNGKCFEDENPAKCLSPQLKAKFLRASIPVIEIKEAMYRDFKPVDLFIRLNNKPYPIKDNSFEMWNTILPNDLLKTIKENTRKNENWFYIKNKNRDSRMKNEELYAILMFLEARKGLENNKDIIHFKKNGQVAFRLTSKAVVTKYFYQIALNDKFDEIKNSTEKFLEKLKILLSDNSKCTEEYLEKELNKIIIISKKKQQRSDNIIYALWYFLAPISLDVIKNNSVNIRADIKSLIKYLTHSLDNKSCLTIYETFQKDLESFFVKYSTRAQEPNPPEKVQVTKSKPAKPIQAVKSIPKIKNNKLRMGRENTVVNVSINVQSDNSNMKN